MTRKQCGKCGWVGAVSPRVRRCRRQRIPGGYACWGQLRRVPASRKALPGRYEERPQDRTAKELVRVRRRIADVARQLAQRSRVLAALVARAGRLEKAAAMTDAERQMLSAARSAQAKEAAQVRRERRGKARAITFKEEV